MAARLIAVLKAEKVEFVVSPFESDAQCAFLSRTGQVACVVSEDSDMIPYGCSRVFFKMDNEGNGEEVRSKNLGANEDVDLINWLPGQLLEMCILSGCDYLQSLPGIGIKKAHGLIARHKSGLHAIQQIRRDGMIDVPDSYEEDFKRALLTFRHQMVWDNRENRRAHLTEIEDDMSVSDLGFLGKTDRLTLEDEQQIAEAVLNPRTLQPFAVEAKLPEWRSTYRGEYDAVPQSNTLDKYLKPVARQPELMELFDLAEKRARGEASEDEGIPKQQQRPPTKSAAARPQIATANPFAKPAGRSRPSTGTRQAPSHPAARSISSLGAVGPTVVHRQAPVPKKAAKSRFFRQPGGDETAGGSASALVQPARDADPEEEAADLLDQFRYANPSSASQAASKTAASSSRRTASRASGTVISLRPQVDIRAFQYAGGTATKRKATPEQPAPLKVIKTNAKGAATDSQARQPLASYAYQRRGAR